MTSKHLILQLALSSLQRSDVFLKVRKFFGVADAASVEFLLNRLDLGDHVLDLPLGGSDLLSQLLHDLLRALHLRPRRHKVLRLADQPLRFDQCGAPAIYLQVDLL